ncbi:hypothetical protein CXF68_01955 [Tenacibaculum sp. Bg11-29]|uniref:hypothetical protein n=1 Tax=Tenacibaculum sp. Bg11-29 TaxID=2058306 RepID=UPI000C349479|nr:hypothetical protein [Tenacibaculum sp. Bg11-29]PKH49527.1 hypothetical protein CXF68_01955 [Tenacibaculum sp. Bg11-29]
MKKKIFIFLIIITIFSCYKEDDYLLSKIDDSFVLISVKNNKIYADGVSSTEVIVEIPYNTKKEFTKITLKTSSGKFKNDKQEIEANISKVVIDGKDKKIAKAKLITSQTVGEITIEARISDITKSIGVIFDRAYPEKIITDLPSLEISNGNQTITLTTKLTRNIGKPSLLTTAKVFAIDSKGNLVGQFLNYSESADKDGILKNQFSLGTTNCNCPNIFIISETNNSENSVIRDTISLIVK